MKYHIKIYTEDSVFVKKRVYFFSKYWNGLYVADLESKVVELVGIMPEEKISAKRLCAGIVYHNNKLILIPMTARKIWIYDFGKDQWSGLERNYMTDGDFHKEIFRAVEYKHYLFLIGSNYPAIIRMNLNTYELTYITEPYTFLTPVKTDCECYFRCDMLLKSNQLLIASCLNNFVLCLNLDTLDFDWYKVGDDDFCYSGITWDGESYWLSPRRGTPIVKWNGKDKTEYFPLPDNFDNSKYNFLGVQYCNGRLVFPGMLQKKTLVIDPNNLQNIEIQEGQYLFYKDCNKKVLLSQTRDGLLQLKDYIKNEQYSMYCEIRKKDWIDFIANKNGGRFYEEIKNEIQREAYPLLLDTYISFIKSQIRIENSKSEIGVNIWETIQN